MTMPDLLERVRMCLAEVGEDPMAASVHPDEPEAISILTSVPDRVSWRAATIARIPDGTKPTCWTCREAAGPWPSYEEVLAAREACEATRPCMEDCGRDRSAPP